MLDTLADVESAIIFIVCMCSVMGLCTTTFQVLLVRPLGVAIRFSHHLAFRQSLPELGSGLVDAVAKLDGRRGGAFGSLLLLFVRRDGQYEHGGDLRLGLQ